MIDQVVCYGAGAGWGEWVVERVVQEVKKRMKGAKKKPEAVFAETHTLARAAEDMKAKHPQHCFSACESQLARARSMVPLDYDDGEDGSRVVLLQKRLNVKLVGDGLLESVVQLLPDYLAANQEQHRELGLGWPMASCVEDFHDMAELPISYKLKSMVDDLLETGDLQVNFYRGASLANGDTVICDGQRYQSKDDRWVYINVPAGDTFVKCVGLVKALVRVSMTDPDGFIPSQRLQQHGLQAPCSESSGKRLSTQPLRLALVEHWRAVACGESLGYQVHSDEVTGRLPDLLHVSNMSKSALLQWRDDLLSDTSLGSTSSRYYGLALFDVAAFPSQLLATHEVVIGPRAALKKGRYFTAPHKSSDR